MGTIYHRDVFLAHFKLVHYHLFYVFRNIMTHLAILCNIDAGLILIRLLSIQLTTCIVHHYTNLYLSMRI